MSPEIGGYSALDVPAAQSCPGGGGRLMLVECWALELLTLTEHVTPILILGPLAFAAGVRGPGRGCDATWQDVCARDGSTLPEHHGRE